MNDVKRDMRCFHPAFMGTVNAYNYPLSKQIMLLYSTEHALHYRHEFNRFEIFYLMLWNFLSGNRFSWE